MDWNQTFIELINKANEGNLDAQIQLHDLYYDHQDAKQEFNDDLISFYEKGANENKPYFVYYYGMMCYLGYGVERDKEKGIELIKKSMEYKCSQAYYMMAIFHLMDLCHFSTYNELLEQAMNMNNANAYIESARDYDSQKDSKMTIKHYKKAIELGSAYAIYKLGEYYHDHNNYNLAKKYYKNAITKNIHHAYFNLAIMYSHGEGFKTNDEKALELYKKAIELGNTRAMVNVASYYENNNRRSDAKKLYKMAIEQDKDPMAYYALGQIYVDEKKIKKAIKLFIAGAKEDSYDCRVMAMRMGVLSLDWDDKEIDAYVKFYDSIKYFGASDIY